MDIYREILLLKVIDFNEICIIRYVNNGSCLNYDSVNQIN